MDSTLKLKIDAPDNPGAAFAKLADNLIGGSKALQAAVGQINGELSSILSKANGTANAIRQLGILGSASSMGVGLFLAAVSTVLDHVAKKQEEARKSAEDLAKAQAEAARAVVSAYDRAIEKTAALRAAQDSLRAERRRRESLVDEGWITKIESQGLRDMLGAGNDEDRAAIARKVAEAVAGARHEADARAAADAADDVLREIRRNDADIAKRRQELANARKIGVAKAEIEKINAAIEAAEARRAALQKKYANAQQLQRNVESAWQKQQLQFQLETQKAAEEAAKKRERLEEKLADLRKRREEEIGKAREKAAELAQRFADSHFASGVQNNLRGAAVQSAADVARSLALTSGPSAQFRRDAQGLVMNGPGYSREEMARIRTEKYQQEVTRLLKDIDRKYDEAEKGVQEEF